MGVRMLTTALAVPALLISPLVAAPPASAAPSSAALIAALDAPTGTVSGVTVNADSAAAAVATSPVAGFPTKSGSYLVLSTGDANVVVPGTADTFITTDLPGAPGGADGHDLTQVRLRLAPPAGATCVAFDFAFLSEEYPEYVGSQFNDIFTAELNDSQFTVSNNQVVAPFNFAYDSSGNPVSINTVFGMSPIPGTNMDGATPALTAKSPLEKGVDGGYQLILSVQDLGDSALDSAVVVDNLRFGNGANCTEGTVELTDTDGDGLPDSWETNGLDVDSDGVVDLDLPAMGASPTHKDLFIETDWIANRPPTCIWLVCWGGRSFAPDQGSLADVRKAFANAPVSNPDGTPGIRAHIDSGASSVMNPVTGATWGNRSRSNQLSYVASLGTISGSSYQWGSFDTIKKANTDLARRDVFHYAVYADTYAGSGSSGISRGIVAADYLLTDGHSSWGNGFTRTQERGTFMHELGHGLGLHHGGDTDETNRSGYNSIMSYAYQLTGLPPNSTLDYSRTSPFVDWTHLRLDGGAIGARGDTAVIPDESAADEPTAADFKAAGTFGTAGDGVLAFAGPTVLLSNSGVASLMYDVTNVGATSASYTVTVDGPGTSLDGTATKTVAAGATSTLSVPVSTTGLVAGTLSFAAALSSATLGSGLSTTTNDVIVPDLTVPAVLAAAKDALTQLGALPANSGLNPAVKTAVQSALTTAVIPPAPKTWTAKVYLSGALSSTFTTQLDTVTFTPNQSKPTAVKLTSTPGSPTLGVDLTLPKKHLFLEGTLVVQLPKNDTLTAKFTGATWERGRLRLAGIWKSKTNPKLFGTFFATLTPPPGGTS